MNRAHNQEGFTLVELMFAMTFISVLLLSIALTVIQISNIYNKGMTVKEVNQSSREISDELRRSISASQGINMTDGLRTYSAGGRMCLGSYTYIWNTSTALQTSDTTRAQYHRDSEKRATPIRFVKVPDASGLYCALDTNGALAQRDVRIQDEGLVQELLESGDRVLQMHSFSVLPSSTTAVDVVTDQRLYAISYTIGTGDITAMNSARTACLEPGQQNADPNFCTAQQFTILIRTGMGGN